MQTIPRRWNVQVEGICWLPRMIDKARMSANGALGAYLIGNSPVDKALMRRMNVTTQDFVRIAVDHTDDAAVLAALRARPGFDEARVQRWAGRFTVRYRLFIRLWDLDEGYARPTFLQRLAIGAYRRVERFFSALVRVISPAP